MITSKLNQPTVGRMIHVFPGTDKNLSENIFISQNGAPKIPATVTQIFKDSWNEHYTGVNVVATNDIGSILSLPSLQHKSTVTEGNPYWEWPERE